MPVPDAHQLAPILSRAKLSRSLSAVDLLVYATAVHHGLAVVTGDRQLARALRASGVSSGNVALALQELVLRGDLTTAACDALLADLEAHSELIIPRSQTWVTLSTYGFP